MAEIIQQLQEQEAERRKVIDAIKAKIENEIQPHHAFGLDHANQAFDELVEYIEKLRDGMLHMADAG